MRHSFPLYLGLQCLLVLGKVTKMFVVPASNPTFQLLSGTGAKKGGQLALLDILVLSHIEP